MSFEANTETIVPRDRKPRLFGTFGVQTLDLLLRVVLQILVVRILIQTWGIAVYQDWLILFAATNFLLVLDCGMQTYFVNSMLISRVSNDAEAFRRYIATAMLLYLVVLALTVLLFAVIVLMGVGPSILGLRALDFGRAASVAGLLGASVLSLLPLGIFTGIYRIRGNYGLSTLTSVLTQTLPGFGLCLVASHGGTPVAGALTYFLAAALAWLLVAADQRHRYGEFPFRIAPPTRTELRAVATKSIQYMVSSLAVPVTLHVPVLLLGVLGGAGSVIRYTTTRTLSGLVRQMISQPSLPIGVELAQEYQRGNYDGVRLLFADATQLMSGAAGLLCGYLFVMADPVLHLWTHGEVAYDPWLVAIFVANVVGVAPAQIAQAFFLHINRPRPLIVATTGFTLSAVPLCLLLIGKLSAAGAALAFCAAEICFVGLFVPFAACRQIGLPVLPYAANCIRVLATGFALGYGLAWLLTEFVAVSSFGNLIGTSLLWAFAVLLPAYFLLLTSKMRGRAKQLISSRFSANP
jgi:O-antigen/teichoic acid export membrane protein